MLLESFGGIAIQNQPLADAQRFDQSPFPATDSDSPCGIDPGDRRTEILPDSGVQGRDATFGALQLDDMFTVARLGIGGTLAKTLTNTNCIESMISIAKRTTGRVTRWKDGSMKKRWTVAGMLEAERSFRRVRGYKGMGKLVEALRREITPSVDTTTQYDRAAA